MFMPRLNQHAATYHVDLPVLKFSSWNVTFPFFKNLPDVTTRPLPFFVTSNDVTTRPPCSAGPRCSLTVTRCWLQRVVFPLLDRAWLRRLWRGLSNVRFTPGVVRSYVINRSIYNSGIDSGMARWWGLARHGHDPCPGRRAAQHSPRGSSRSLFMGAALLDFQSGGFDQHLLHRVPASILADDDVLFYGPSSERFFVSFSERVLSFSVCVFSLVQ